MSAVFHRTRTGTRKRRHSFRRHGHAEVGVLGMHRKIAKALAQAAKRAAERGR